MSYYVSSVWRKILLNKRNNLFMTNIVLCPLCRKHNRYSDHYLGSFIDLAHYFSFSAIRRGFAIYIFITDSLKPQMIWYGLSVSRSTRFIKRRAGHSIQIFSLVLHDLYSLRAIKSSGVSQNIVRTENILTVSAPFDNLFLKFNVI